MKLTMSKVKPFLKWAGGKSRIAKQIAGFFPASFNRYYEPFLGSGAVYFMISPQKGLLNDLNKYLIGTYETVRDNPQELLLELDKIHSTYHSLQSLDEKSAYYYEARTRYNSLDSVSTEKAALFIFLKKAGFNGMYRENSKGEYNIPFGKHEKCLISDRDNILEVSKNIQDIKFTSGDYKSALGKAKKGDLVYLDPPYVPVSKTSDFTQYQKEGFNYDEQKRLRDLALELHERGCYVVISNSSCKESKDLYKNPIFQIHTIEITRLIHRSRKLVPEIVVTNFAVEDK